MQAMQDQKELNEGRFGLIDQRWTRVEDAIRLQTQERGNDLSDLNQHIQKQSNLSSSLETRKMQVLPAQCR